MARASMIRTAQLVLAMVVVLLTLSARISMLRSYELNTSGEEQNVVYGVIKLTGTGMPLYTDPEDRPYDVIQYTPGFYYLTAAVGGLCGMDPLEPRTVYLVLRWCGLGLNILFVLLGFVLARRLGAGLADAALWSAVLFSLLARQVHSRPDALHLVFFAGSMLCLLSPRPSTANGQARVPWMATVLGCAAALCKQSGALALFIIGAHLLFSGRWRELGWHILLGCAVLGTAFGLLAMYYGPGVLHANIITGINNGPHEHIGLWVDQNFRRPERVVLQLIGLVTAVSLLRRGQDTDRALGTGILLSYAFALFTTLKHGSSPGYHSENLLLTMAALASRPLVERMLKLRHAGLLLLLVALANVRPDRMLRGASSLDELWRPVPASPDYLNARAMARAFRTDPALQQGLVYLVEHDHLENFLVGRSVGTQKDIICLRTSLAHYDMQRMREDMMNGSIRYVIARGPVDDLPFFGKAHPALEDLGERHGYRIHYNPGDPGLIGPGRTR